MLAEKRKAEIKPAAAVCPTCGEDLTATEKWQPGAVVHCDGKQNSWSFADGLKRHRGRPHHGRWMWYCANPGCGLELGCDKCCGRKPSAILCLACNTFGDGDVVAGGGRKPFLSGARSSRREAAREQIQTGFDLSVPTGDRE